MARQARYFWLFVNAALLPGCVSGRVSAPGTPSARSSSSARLARAPARPEPVDGTEPRLVPPLEGSGAVFVGDAHDGSRRFLSYGLRMLSRPSGALELAHEYLPAARSVKALELPTRLGGGFLFYVLSSSATLFFRAPTFTGDLQPFARLDFEADEVIAGFDRLYVLARRPERLVALDAERGAAIGLGSLPPSPSYTKLAFVDGWFGAVELPFRGTLLTFDAGVSWRPFVPSPTSVAVQDGHLRLLGPDGVRDLDGNGTLTRREQPIPTAPRENEVAQALRGSSSAADGGRVFGDDLSRSARKLAVLRGFRDRDGSLVVASAGALLRVRESDGELLESDRHAYPGGDCSALPFSAGFALACNDGANQTTLYSFRAPFAMNPIRTFSGARYVSSSGNGALVIGGTCDAGNAPGAYCVAHGVASFREIHAQGDFGVERVVALADGRVAVIVPPRLGAPGFLSLIAPNGQERRLPLKLPVGTSGAELLDKGLWLAGFIEQPSGLAGWVAGGEPFAGVRVALDGTVAVGRPEQGIDSALLSANHALLIGRTGRARESSDGGFEWNEVEMPSEFEPGRELRGEAALQGCSAIGCAFGGFLRLGWRSGGAASRLHVAALPAPTPLVQPGGSRWFLRCEATGEVSEPSLPSPGNARAAGPSDDSATPPWGPFLELPAPSLAASEVGYDTAGNEGDAALFHGYAWGERGAEWARAGHAELRAVDRFRVQHGVFQSAVSRSPWPDAAAAAQAFGFDGSGTPSSWRAILDPGQRAAALLVSARGLLDLLLFEDGKTLSHIPNVGRLGSNLGMVSSVAKLSDAWYAAAFNDAHSLGLFRIQGGRVERLAEYPDPGRMIASATLIRDLRGEQLGIWVTGRGWHLFPIDSASHAVQSPLVQTPAELAAMPPVCGPDADGFLLTGTPSLEPSLRFTQSADGFAARRVEAQLLWSARGLCVRALAADTDTSIQAGAPSAAHRLAASSSDKVPLTVSERKPHGRRWGYLCSP